MPHRVLITGCRHWSPGALIARVLRSIKIRCPDGVVIVHGACATGVDACVATWCERLSIEQERHPARWHDVDSPDANPVDHWTGRTYDAAAGPRRNAEMVALGATYAIALHRNLRWSKGTRDCVRRCLDANIPVWLIGGQNETHKVTREELER